jgi:hypothetical protein
MSNSVINGTLILNSDLYCSGSVTIEPDSTVIPIANEVIDQIYSCPIQDYIWSNGKSPTIVSKTSDIIIDGIIDGKGRGYSANSGPGANSLLNDVLGKQILFYGATHAGIGSAQDVSGTIQYYEEQYIISSAQADSRSIILSATPTEPENVAVSFAHGIAQEYLTDFNIDLNILSWKTSNLDSVVIAGDILKVIYMGDNSRTMVPPKKPYGNYEAPLSIGSGSGEANGGSGIRLIARHGTINLSGSINVDGDNGTSEFSGGGSGGSVWLIGKDLTGNGSISAQGGSASYTAAGGGAGGYIALNYEYNNFLTSTLSVAGQTNSTKGIIYERQIDPFFQEKFTGTILNKKWWEIVDQPITVNNNIQMDTTVGDNRSSLLQSKFQLSGKYIHTDIDFIPSGSEPSYNETFFKLAVDDDNWVGIVRKYNYMFGMYAVDGIPSQIGVPYAYLPSQLKINKVDTTFNFQFIDSSTITHDIFTQVIPEFEKSKFFVQIGANKGFSDSSRKVEYVRLNDTDIANESIFLSSLPSDSSNVTLNMLNGSSQLYGVEYYSTGQELKWGLPRAVDWKIDSTQTFTWSAPDILSNVKIELSRDNGSTWEIVAADTSNTGSYPWVVTDPVANSALIKISGLIYTDPIDLSTIDFSDIVIISSTVFSISEVAPPDFNELPLNQILQSGDILRTEYDTTVINHDLNVSFDNFRVFKGNLHNIETTDSVLYVDSSYGSDLNDGQRLTPLKNLFVASAWSKNGGTIVLYDGTYGATEIQHKNVSILGANGVSPIIKTVPDSTGSNWENSCLTFKDCQGSIKNVQMSGAVDAIYALNTHDIEIEDCTIYDSTTGIRFEKYTMNPKILSNTIYDTSTAVILDTQVFNPYIYSNVIYDCSTAINLIDATNYTICSNTIDNVITGIQV